MYLRAKLEVPGREANSPAAIQEEAVAFVNNTMVLIYQLLNLNEALSTGAACIRKITGIGDVTRPIEKCDGNFAF